MPETSEPSQSRRSVLGKMLVVSAGVCFAALGAFSLFDLTTAESLGESQASHSSTATVGDQEPLGSGSSVPQSSSTTITANNKENADLATIEVAYFGFTMVQFTGTSKEYLKLASPIYLQDVLTQVEKKHIALAPMLPLMSIVVNGTPVTGNPQLANNSEVDLIPSYAGG